VTTADLDVLFFTEPAFLLQVEQSRATRKIFYHVLKSEKLHPILKNPAIEVFANSQNLLEFDKKKYRISPFYAAGGVDTTLLRPGSLSNTKGKQTTILTYGRLKMKRKGTRFVVSACEKLYRKGYDIHLILFDTPHSASDRERIAAFRCSCPFTFITDHPVVENRSLYRQADIFASAEKNAGWANTCAEAMACGIPVVATGSGSRDFLEHRTTGLCVDRNTRSIVRALEYLLKNPAERLKLGRAGRERIERFDWKVLAKRIVSHLETTGD